MTTQLITVTIDNSIRLFFKRIHSQKNVILSVKHNIQNYVNYLIEQRTSSMQNNRDSRFESEAQFKSFFSLSYIIDAVLCLVSARTTAANEYRKLAQGYRQHHLATSPVLCIVLPKFSPSALSQPGRPVELMRMNSY